MGSRGERLLKSMVIHSPCQSIILDPWDKVWKDHFSEEELQEIKRHKARPFKSWNIFLKKLAKEEDRLIVLEGNGIALCTLPPTRSPCLALPLLGLENRYANHHAGYSRR